MAKFGAIYLSLEKTEKSMKEVDNIASVLRKADY